MQSKNLVSVEIQGLCGWRDSNPHALWAGDFKSGYNHFQRFRAVLNALKNKDSFHFTLQTILNNSEQIND